MLEKIENLINQLSEINKNHLAFGLGESDRLSVEDYRKFITVYDQAKKLYNDMGKNDSDINVVMEDFINEVNNCADKFIDEAIIELDSNQEHNDANNLSKIQLITQLLLARGIPHQQAQEKIDHIAEKIPDQLLNTELNKVEPTQSPSEKAIPSITSEKVEHEVLEDMFNAKPSGYDLFSMREAKENYQKLGNISIQTIVNYAINNPDSAECFFKKRYGMEKFFGGRNFRDELSKNPDLTAIYHEARVKHAFGLGKTKEVKKHLEKLHPEEKTQYEKLVQNFRKLVKGISAKVFTLSRTEKEPKNKATETLELMLKSFLVNNKSVEFTSDGNQVFAKFHDIQYDMEKLLQQADFDRIEFTEHDFGNYENFLKNDTTLFKPYFISNINNPIEGVDLGKKVTEIQELKEHFEKTCQTGSLKNTSFAEKLAANLYTTEAYGAINKMFRGEISSANHYDIYVETLPEKGYSIEEYLNNKNLRDKYVFIQANNRLFYTNSEGKLEAILTIENPWSFLKEKCHYDTRNEHGKIQLSCEEFNQLATTEANNTPALNAANLAETMLTGVMFVHCLNRMSGHKKTNTFRIDKSLPEHIVNERVETAKQKKRTVVQGIVSVAINKPDFGFHQSLDSGEAKKGTAKVATLIRGTKLYDISKVNAMGENEAVMKPNTIVKWKAVRKIGEVFYLIGSPSKHQKYRREKINMGSPTGDDIYYETKERKSFENKINNDKSEKINRMDRINPTTKDILNNLESYPINQYHYREVTITRNNSETTLGTNGKLEVRIFNQDSYNGPQTEDFIARAKSLHSTAVYMNFSQNAAIKIKLDANLKNLIEDIEKQAKIDPAEIKKETGEKYFSEKHSIALKLLHNFNLENIKTLHPEGDYNLVEELSKLEKTESQVVANAGRSNLLYIYEAAGQTRVSISEAQGNHTNPSTMRDKPELSNFVKVSSGYVEKESGEAKIEFSAYRHTSYPSIHIFGNSIEAKMERRNGAVQSVKQMLQTLAQDMIIKDPTLSDKQPIEIKLSSMILLTPLLKDQKLMGSDSEMRQLKDSLIALNICNNQEITVNGITFKSILTQMNIPANTLMEAQFKKLGGGFNDSVNNKGFYEYNKNFIEFIEVEKLKKPNDNSAQVFQKILDIYKKDVVLENLEIRRKDIQDASPRLTDLYKKLGELQKGSDYSKNSEIYKTKLKEIRAKEKELNGAYKEIVIRQKETWEFHSTEIKNFKISINQMLKKDPDNTSLQVAQLYLDSAEIYYTDAHKLPEHAHQFQTRYLLANEKMGNIVEFFCKSGEDRTGRANNHLEEFLAFRRENNVFPEFNNKSDIEKLEKISHNVHNGSVSKEITNQNAPGARGLQQESEFGSNAALQLGEFDQKMATMAKGIYGSTSQKIKYKLQAKLPPISREKEFKAIEDEFKVFLEEKLSIEANLSQTKIENTPIERSMPTHIALLQHTELLELEEKAKEIFSKLEADSTDVDSTDADSILVTEPINTKTGCNIDNTRFSTISGAPSRPVQKNPAQIQDDTIKAISSVFEGSQEFKLTCPRLSESVDIMKNGNKFASVNTREIQAFSETNSADDYKILIQAALKNYDKPLLIYIPESEKPTLDKAIDDLQKDPHIKLKYTDFECTTNRQEYETRQKAQEVASASNQAPTKGSQPKREINAPKNQTRL